MKDFGRFVLAVTVCSLIALPMLVVGLVIYLYCLLPDWPRKEDMNQP